MKIFNLPISLAIVSFSITVPVSAAIVFEEIDIILPDEQIQEEPLEIEDFYQEFDCDAKQVNQSHDITPIKDSNTPQIETNEPCLW